jgi:hypothetical protein
MSTTRRGRREVRRALHPTLMIFHGGKVKDQYMGLLSKKALADRVDKVL